MNYFKSRASLPRAIIRLGEYEEKLPSGIILRRPIKEMVNISELGVRLSELNYPLTDEFLMALRTANPKKISQAHARFRHWVGSNYSTASDYVENTLFHYQSVLYGNDFPEEDVAKTALAESKILLEKMAHSVELAASRIPTWRNHTIMLDAITPSFQESLIVTEARVEVGDAFRLNFIYSKCPTGFSVSEVNFPSAPPSVDEDFRSLVTLLRQNPKFNKIMTLYMARPVTERRYYEIAQRDISLGIKAVLPGHVTLTENAKGEGDTWKVRVEDKYLQENNGYFSALGEEIPIKWIELCQKG